MGGFNLEWWYPQNGWFMIYDGKPSLKMDDLGGKTHHFRMSLQPSWLFRPENLPCLGACRLFSHHRSAWWYTKPAGPQWPPRGGQGHRPNF